MSKLKMCSALVILLFLWKHDFVESIRILELRVPGHVEEGGQALLGCQFDLEGDRLYSVHWYKDDQEFYRFVPTNSEPTSNFPVPGVFVNVARSSSTVVALEHLTKDSGGRYRCEVSGEAPFFATASEVKDVKVYLLPNNVPRMTELKNEYEIGDTLKVNCTSSRSRPRAHVKWLVNNQSAPESYLRGPWEWRSRERPDARVTTLELNFVLLPFHFHEGVLTVECQVTLAPLYHDKIVHHIILRTDPAPVDEASETIQQIYEASVFSESHAQTPDVESQKDDYFKGNTVGTKVTAWVVLPTIVLLQLFF